MRKKMATTRNTTGVFTPWQEKHAYLYRDLVLNKQRCVFCVHSPIEQKHGSTAQSKGEGKIARTYTTRALSVKVALTISTLDADHIWQG